MTPTEELTIALVGNPNCGKTALFNALTGGNQKVANYSGVTVEKKEGWIKSHWSDRALKILDLPGVYSLTPQTPDEEITRDVVLGNEKETVKPDLLIVVVNATHLSQNLSLVLELMALGLPLVVALNQFDQAEKQGIKIQVEKLSQLLDLPVIATVATKNRGISELVNKAQTLLDWRTTPKKAEISSAVSAEARFRQVDEILKQSVIQGRGDVWTERIDRWVLHPFWGLLLLAMILVLVFQAVFSWATPPADFIEESVTNLGNFICGFFPAGILRDLIADGIFAGVGSVLVFLPQILVLFLFVLVLEDTGYMARAAFLMDRLMGKVGLHGRAFIPLLSSYACAIPGIMATRNIESPRDRLTTIMVAPLTTCSARLPIYTLLIGAFIPNLKILGVFGLQGLVLFALYFIGIFLALLIAFLMKRTVLRGEPSPLILELPPYRFPALSNTVLGLRDRAFVFVKNAGTVILTISIVLWFLSNFPKSPADATEPAISYSIAGKIGKFMEPFFAPIGFNWKIAIALIPGFAAREVMVSALGTVYAVEGAGDSEGSGVQLLSGILQKEGSLATALSLLMWYVIALQCLSTVAVVKRETNSWKWPLFQLGYLTCLAYGLSWVTYHLTLHFVGSS